MIDRLMTRASVRGHEARQGLEAFGAYLSRAVALPIEIRWGGIPTANIDGMGRVTLADIADDAVVTRATLARYAGFLLHECLHRKWTSFAARDPRPYVAALHNAVEDAWIERRCIAEGLVGNAQGLLRDLIQQMADRAMTEVTDWAAPGQYPFSLAVFLRQYGPTVPVPAGLMPIYREALRRLPACQSSRDTLTLAQWVFDQMQQQQQDDQQDDQQEDPGEDQGDDQQGDDEAADQGGDQGDQGDEQGDDQQQGQGDKQGQQQGDADGDAQKGTQQPADAGAAQRPVASQQAREVEPQPDKGSGLQGVYTRAGSEGEYMLRSSAARTLATQVPGRLRYEVRRLFENSATDWREAGHRSGRLDAGSLHRLPTGRQDLFSRRYEREGIDSAAVILIDLSGSMAGNPLDAAVSVAWALLETLTQAGVDAALAGFDDDHYLFRPFGATPARRTKVTLERIRVGGSTNDWQAVRFCHDMLHAHRAQRKVLFAITDGCGDAQRVRQQVDAAARVGVATVGVGIRHDVEASYGPGAIRVESLHDLGRASFSQIKVAA